MYPKQLKGAKMLKIHPNVSIIAPLIALRFGYDTWGGGRAYMSGPSL